MHFNCFLKSNFLFQISTWLKLRFVCSFILIVSSNLVVAQNSIQDNLDSAQAYVEKQSFLNAYLFCNSALVSLKVTQNQDLELQYNTYLEYVKVVNQVIKLIDSPDSKRLFYELEYQSYEKIIELATLLSKKNSTDKYAKTAFQLIERNKNIILRQTLRNADNNSIAGISDEILMQEGQFIAQLTALENQRRLALANIDTDKNLIEQLEQQRDKTQKEYNIFKQKMRSLYPNYYKFQGNDEINIEQLQNELSSSEAFIEYFYGTEAVYVFIITKGDIQLLHLSDISTIKQLITKYKQVLQDNEKELIKTSFSLYQYLFQPITKHIQGVSEVTIITDGLLSYIPFDGLITKFPKDWNYDFSILNYLIYDYQISYHHSAKDFLNTYSKPHHFSKDKVLVIAPLFTNDVKSHYKKKLPKDTLYDECTALLKSRQLIASIEQKFSTKTLIANEANYTNFVSNTNHSVLHFATHTIINEATPLLSKIILSKDFNDNYPSENGYIYLKDLYEMSLNTELIVLGSCETGNGQFKIGEGMVSFSYGFNMAGAESTIYSLWKVDEKATVRLMDNFYKYLNKGFPKDKALHLAKIDFLKKANELQSNPYYWAGFVFNGQKKPLSFSKNQNSKRQFMPFLIGFFFALSIFIWWQSK